MHLKVVVFLVLLTITVLYLGFYKFAIDSLALNHVHFSKTSPKHTAYNIALVVCGHRLQESLVVIKSIILFNDSRKGALHFWVFTENRLMAEFEERLNMLKNVVHFGFTILPLDFPKQSRKEWMSLFKPCAAQRLFLPLLLPEVDSVLYVDIDVIFLSPVSDIWHRFTLFNTSQFAALAAEHEDENIGWYNRFARHPYYGRTGLNSGVMLMNLTRMRLFRWVSHMVPIYDEYKLRITWGDQDIINVFFYFNPETLYLLPCEYNYRPDHCMYVSACNVSVNGIKILHGNRGYFHSKNQPLFKAVYEVAESYQVGSDPYFGFLLPLRTSLNQHDVTDTNCGVITKGVLHVAEKLFEFDNTRS